MKVKILKVSTGELQSATITKGKAVELPSIHAGWKYNFDKLSKTLPNAETYVLVSEESPDIIEGCLIFQMIDKQVPYMAYLEIAPHNKTDPKKYDWVAGCLIAFAFKQSLKAKRNYQGQLFLDADEENAQKLINVYRKKYGALLIGDTRLVIMDEVGHELIEKYLE